MVKAPSQSPDQKPHKQVLVSTHQIYHYHHTQPIQHHNSKKYRRDQQLMANESPGNGSGGMTSVEASTSGGTLVVTSIPVTVPPMVAVVAPTTRATVNTLNGNQQQQHISNSSSPVKVSANVMHQQQQPQRTQHLHTTTPHVSHVFHQFALPIQIPANLAAATTTQAAGAAWPLAEPVFHFGPGFEPRQVCPQHGTSTTSQANNPEHLVFFHVSPGVSVTFQVAGNREVVRGE